MFSQNGPSGISGSNKRDFQSRAGRFVHFSQFLKRHKRTNPLLAANREVDVNNLDKPYYNKCFLKGVRVKELELTISLL
jgi:hypothetical protein